MKILVTGTGGFIGYHLALRLLERGDEVMGLDSVNDYYDVSVKYGRLDRCGVDSASVEYGKMLSSKKYPNYRFVQMKLEDKGGIDKLFADEKFDRVCNLAAQAGVCYSWGAV